MRLIVVGCEYAGKTTLLDGLAQWGRERDIRYHVDDHFSIPDCQTLKDKADQKAIHRAPQAIKERFQRFQIAYHVRLLHKYQDILLAGFHIEEAVYGSRYYYPNLGKSFETPQSWERDMPPDTLLVLLSAGPEVIQRRMAECPHEYSILPGNHVQDILGEFQTEFQTSWLKRKFQIDTSDLSPDELLQAFLEASVPHLNAKDLLVRMQTSKD